MVKNICMAPGCLTKLATDNDTGYCEIHKNMRPNQHLKGKLSKEDSKLLEYAHEYGFALGEEQSLRRFREHILGLRDVKIIPRIIEVTCENGRYIFHSKPGEMRGPVADVEETFLLPSGTTIGYPRVCSGEVSGQVYQGVIASGLQRPIVILKAEANCSGVIVQWIKP